MIWNSLAFWQHVTIEKIKISNTKWIGRTPETDHQKLFKRSVVGNRIKSAIENVYIDLSTVLSLAECWSTADGTNGLRKNLPESTFKGWKLSKAEVCNVERNLLSSWIPIVYCAFFQLKFSYFFPLLLTLCLLLAFSSCSGCNV